MADLKAISQHELFLCGSMPSNGSRQVNTDMIQYNDIVLITLN